MLKVSVITPSYNQGDFIADTLASVASQTGVEIEHIVIDGGSTDNSVRVIESYAESLTYWQSRSDKGQSDAINQGWRLASGDILCWLNSDDVFLPGAVAKVVEFFESHPETDIVFGDCLFLNEAGVEIGRSARRTQFHYPTFISACENIIAQPAAFIRRSVYESVGELDVSLRLVMDWEYWMRAGLNHSIHYLPGPLAGVRFHPQSKTSSEFTRNLPDELARIYMQYFATPGLPSPLLALRRISLSNMCITAAGYSSRGGHTDAARRWAKRAIEERPGALVDPATLRRLASVYWGNSRAYNLARKVMGRSGAHSE